MKLTFEELANTIPNWLQFPLHEDLIRVQFGKKNAPVRLLWDSGAHGAECAAPLALLEFVQQNQRSWKWPHVNLVAVVADGKGFDDSGYGFVGADKHESSWPPLWGYRQDDGRYWTFVDRNSAWGNAARSHLPDSHLALRNLMDEFKPTFVLSTHETVTNERKRGLFWPGCGIMVIENYAIAPELYNKIIGMPDPISNPLGFVAYLIRRWKTFLLPIPRWKRNANLLAAHPDWQLVTDIVARYKEGGNPVMGQKWLRYLELFGELSVGEGRVLHGPGFYASDWMVVTDYATRNFGCPGITTETFPCGEIGCVGLDWRIKQNVEFVKATLDVLEGEANV
jgi:hypothetical protein